MRSGSKNQRSDFFHRKKCYFGAIFDDRDGADRRSYTAETLGYREDAVAAIHEPVPGPTAKSSVALKSSAY